MPLRFLFCALSVSSACPAPEAGVPDERELRTVIFSGSDAAETGFSQVGFKRSLSGPIDASGPVLLASIGSKTTPERISLPGRTLVVDRTAVQASALFGWQWMLETTTLAVFIGPEFDRDWLGRKIARDRDGDAIGLRIQAELWSHPTPETLLTATAVAGTARGHGWARLSAGYVLLDEIFVGPEISGHVEETYRKGRLGLHATGLRVGRYTFRLSGGLQRDSDGWEGGYVTVGSHFKL